MGKVFYFGVIFVLPIIIKSSSEYKCVKQGPCMCKFDEYTLLDLTHLLPSNTKFIQDTQGNYTYFFSGCRDEKFNATDYQLNSTQILDASLVQCVQKIFSFSYNIGNSTATGTYMNHTCSAIGHSDQIKYDSPSDNTNSYQLIYDVKKEGSSPSIQLVCDNYKQTDLKITNHESDELVLYSPLVCIEHLPHHELSTGSIFCILFFTAAIIYFVGGGVIMYTARGARGVEIIPNYDFWASLPGLMRDGLVFILSGCRPFTVATAETYDRI